MSTDRNLLFGVLALQADLLDRDQFAEACAAWAARKDGALADLLVERGWLSDEDRSHVEYLLERKVQKHAGNTRASLAAAATPEARGVLESLHEPTIQTVVAALPPAPTYAVASTVAYRPEGRARYTLTRLHAQGGLGQVWLATDADLGREVALKELKPERRDDPALAGRFLEEARITGQLEHPGIVPVYELVRSASESGPFYTMRFVRGRTLGEAIRDYHRKRQLGKAGPLDLRELLSAFVSVCNAVAYAHSRGVLHRDLKPVNVALGDYGEVMVLDWGLAKVLGKADEPSDLRPVSLEGEPSRDATVEGQVVGTPAYMAPEQAEGRLDRLDARTDVYGLGAVLYELLTGAVPFTGTNTPEVLQRVMHDPPVPPRQRSVPVAPALEAICLKALAKRSEERYPSARDLAKDVERWLADEPVAAWPEPWTVRLGRWVRRHQTGVAAVAAALLMAILLGSGGAFWLQRQQARRQAEEARQAERRRQGVDTVLAEVTRLREQARWGAGLALLEQAGLQMSEAGSEDLEQRLTQARNELELTARLDAIRARKENYLSPKAAYKAADDAYAREFARAGLGQEGDDPRIVAERVRQSTVPAAWMAALNDWVLCARSRPRVGWLLAVARQADPDPWRDRPRDPARWNDREALERLVAEKAAEDQPSQLLLALAGRTQTLGSRGAELLRRIQAQRPGDFWVNYSLGYQFLLTEPGEAVGYYRAALAVRPDDPTAHLGLATALQQQGRLPDAERAYRRALQLDPNHASAHCGLGSLRQIQGRLADAQREYEQALRFDPEMPEAHFNLGIILQTNGRLDDAKAEYNKAIDLDTTIAVAHHGLADVLRLQGQLPEAKQAYHRAREQGDASAAPLEQLCERFLQLRGRLAGVLAGKDRPASGAEWLGFADLCRQPFERRWAAAARFYTEAFAADPKLAEELPSQHRYHAAYVAALAAAGQGVDAGQLDDAAKVRLRTQALGWLQSELTDWKKQLARSSPAERVKVLSMFHYWKQDSDLASVRDDLGRLPEAEREPWKKLWAEVDAVLAQGQR